MAPATKEVQFVLQLHSQVTDLVQQLPRNAGFTSDDVVKVGVRTAPKTRVEVASLCVIFQYFCDAVLSNTLHDATFDFSRVRLPFSWPQKSVRDIVYADTDSPIGLELISTDCRVILFRRNDAKARDAWYESIKNWRGKKEDKKDDKKDDKKEYLPNRFHLLLNELVENVSAHAQLPDERFCFSVGLHFYSNKLFYCVADCGVGLRGSLDQAIVDDAKNVAGRACALHLTRPHFTSKGIVRGHQGIGLFITSELSQMNRGHLEILSGAQEYEQRDNTVMRVRGIPAEWKGTMVYGSINLDQEFNYRKAMKLFDDPSSLGNDRFVVAQIHLNVYGQRTLRTRELCEQIINDLEVAVERSTKIILDFADICEISQAFNGFLRQFVVKHSKVRMMIIIPPNVDEDLKEDLQDLIDMAAKHASFEDDD